MLILEILPVIKSSLSTILFITRFLPSMDTILSFNFTLMFDSEKSIISS